ncbi:hypothetical protein ABTX81_11890 [Kitasatospora sp. NPDC097605]|uniref:hypothetical protein n=1 Tax=Kitasatospora sp. NPDC097605 TaxID=3157226 RepID=UPI00332E08DE
MSGTVITDLRRRGAVDPSRVLTGPLRAVGLQWLDPGRSVEITAEGVERALYITAGSGTATVPQAEATAEATAEAGPGSEATAADAGIPLVEGTAVTLPLGAHTVFTAGTAGLEFFHAVLAVAGHPGRARAHPAAERPTTERPRTGSQESECPGAERPGAEPPGAARPGAARPGAERPGAERPAAEPDGRTADHHPDHPETPPSQKGGETR